MTNTFYLKRINIVSFLISYEKDYDIYIPSGDGGHYEVYINKQLNWAGAGFKCVENGGKLAVISSLDEKKFIVDSITKSNIGEWKNLWIGLRKGVLLQLYSNFLRIYKISKFIVNFFHMFS